MLYLLIAALLLLYLLYRNTARPSNFPRGPLNLPLVGYLPSLTEYPHKTWMQLAQKYGEVFSINMGSYRVVILSSMESIKSAFKEDAITGRPRLTMNWSWSQGKGLAFNDGKVWSEMRRFTVRHLKDLGMGKSSLEGTIRDEILEFVSSIRAQQGQPIDLAIKINLAVVNALWTITTGDKFCHHDDPKGAETVEGVLQCLKDSSAASSLEFIPWLRNVGPFKKITITSLENIEIYRAVMKSFVDKEYKGSDSDPERPHFTRIFLDQVSKTKDPTSPFYGEDGYQNLVTVLMDLFAGGVDTTGVVLLWFVLFMVLYPKVQRKIQAEIDEAVPNDQLPGLEHRAKMPYTEAVLLETMRFSEFVPTGLMHAALRDTKIMGYDVPKDTIVIPNLYHVLHDPKHWKKPEEFYPEHFLDSAGTLTIPDAFIQFGSGKRLCPGESLARMQLFLFAATLLQQFDFSLPEGEPLPSLKRCPGLINSPQNYRIIAKTRNASNI